MRLRSALLPPLFLLLAACCGADEERTVVAFVPEVRRAVVETATGVDSVALGSDLFETAPAFSGVWSAVADQAAPYEALRFPLGGFDAPFGSGMWIAVPLPLREGSIHPIGRAVAPPAGGFTGFDPDLWGRWDLADEDAAEVSLRLGDFVATSAAGTVEVVDVAGDTFDLRLDLTATDDAGRTVRVRAELIRIEAQRYTPSCT